MGNSQHRAEHLSKIVWSTVQPTSPVHSPVYSPVHSPVHESSAESSFYNDPLDIASGDELVVSCSQTLPGRKGLATQN